EVGPGVDRRGEIVRAAAAVLGMAEGELGEAHRVLGPEAAREERRVQDGERSRRVLVVAFDEILVVEEIVGPAADLAGGQRVARDLLPCLAGTHVAGLERRGARRREEARAAEQRGEADAGHLVGVLTEIETASR